MLFWSTGNFNLFMEIRDFYNLKPLEKLFKKINIFDAFWGTNIYSTKISIWIKPIHSTASYYELVLRTPFIWVYISTHVNNVPQEWLYWPKSGSVSKDRLLKSGTSSILDIYFISYLFLLKMKIFKISNNYHISRILFQY